MFCAERPVRSVIYYTRNTVEERLLAIRQAAGDFDEVDTTDHLVTLNTAAATKAAEAVASAGGGGGKPRLGFAQLVEELGIDFVEVLKKMPTSFEVLCFMTD